MLWSAAHDDPITVEEQVTNGLRGVRAGGWWKSSTAVYLLRAAAPRRADDLPSDDASLRAAAEWLARAQDATSDGGIAGRYRLAGGWSSSYPETTGYAIPTLLELADVLADDQYRQRAGRSVEFLRAVQLPSGAFPALEIGENRINPSPFNSAQIVHGLWRWYLATGDASLLDVIVRAARWICSVQDDDGAWRRHFYGQLACAYGAYAACWLAEIADDVNEPRFRASAERNLRWVLGQRDPETGWFDRCGFSEIDHHCRRAPTHTIAYTLEGVRRLSERLNVQEGRDAVRVAATRLLERLERSATLAGVLNHRWQPQAGYVCLSGNAQMAVLWLRLAQATRDLRFVNAAFKAIDEVKRAQVIAHRNGGIRGGVPGSWPIGGDYIPFALPNWAAKFFIDALCAKRACLCEWLDSVRRPAAGARLESMPVRVFPAPPGVPSAAAAQGAPPGPRRVVVYTVRISPKFAALAARWRRRHFAPSLVVIEGSRSPLRRLWTKLGRRPDSSVRVCRRFGWPYRYVSSVNTPAAVAAVEQVRPVVAVAAGAGILRRPLLSIPALGTLNAHMGLLPAYRGMNACEWAAFSHDAIGCSVSWIDEGIDTGVILDRRCVEVEGCRTIAELRNRVDECQLDLLDGTLQSIIDRGEVPAGAPQRAEEGRQFFRMHADLRRRLEQVLSAMNRSSRHAS